MTETGFEPAPFRTGALIQRLLSYVSNVMQSDLYFIYLRPLGHSVVGVSPFFKIRV